MSSELPRTESARTEEAADERGGPEPLAAVLRRAFTEWAGPCCSECGLPALLHGERCDEEAGR